MFTFGAKTTKVERTRLPKLFCCQKFETCSILRRDTKITLPDVRGLICLEGGLSFLFLQIPVVCFLHFKIKEKKGLLTDNSEPPSGPPQNWVNMAGIQQVSEVQELIQEWWMEYVTLEYFNNFVGKGVKNQESDCRFAQGKASVLVPNLTQLLSDNS